MLIIISLLFAYNAGEAEGEEVLSAVQLFSATTLFSEEVESAFGEVLILLFAVSLEFSFLVEDNKSVEEESDIWLKSSFVF